MNDEYIVKTVLHAGSEIINFIPGTKVYVSVVSLNYTRFLFINSVTKLFIISFISGYISL